MIYLFDVDGTLTPSRKPITAEFYHEFLEFCKSFPVALVTGSDYKKTQEQLGDEILDSVLYSFNCSGNAIYRNGKLIYAKDWTMPDDLRARLLDLLKHSTYPGVKTGCHIEERTGSVNFSVVGRNATDIQRKDYYNWDLVNQERHTIAKIIRTEFSEFDAVVGGETGIDIFPIGNDKSQVLSRIDTEAMFFGDQCVPGGNDYPLAIKIETQRRGTWVKCKKLAAHTN